MEIFNTSNQIDNPPIKHVCCNVKGCAYNDGKNHCTAEQISIGPTNACSCTDTVCATFKSN